jgi:hypothetical protein
VHPFGEIGPESRPRLDSAAESPYRSV